MSAMDLVVYIVGFQSLFVATMAMFFGVLYPPLSKSDKLTAGIGVSIFALSMWWVF